MRYFVLMFNHIKSTKNGVWWCFFFPKQYITIDTAGQRWKRMWYRSKYHFRHVCVPYICVTFKTCSIYVCLFRNEHMVRKVYFYRYGFVSLLTYLPPFLPLCVPAVWRNGQKLAGNEWNGYVRTVSVSCSIKKSVPIIFIAWSLKCAVLLFVWFPCIENLQCS